MSLSPRKTRCLSSRVSAAARCSLASTIRASYEAGSHAQCLANHRVSQLHGYHGRLLIVDLSAATHREEQIAPEILQAFVGGTGLATYLLYRLAPPGVEPFSAANPLIFVNSPLVGSAVTTSSKYTVITKSPLTGMIGDSLSSSHLAVELKRTGYDAIALIGQSPEWTYVEVTDAGVRFHNAQSLLGL